MITYGILLVFITILGGALQFLPTVTSFPIPGVDTALITFSSDIREIMIVMPWMQIPLTLMLFALFFKMMFLLLHFVVFIINLIRGSGTKAPTSAAG